MKEQLQIKTVGYSYKVLWFPTIPAKHKKSLLIGYQHFNSMKISGTILLLTNSNNQSKNYIL